MKSACLPGASRPTRCDLRSWSATWALLFATLSGTGAAHADPVETSTGDWLEWNRGGDAEACPEAEAFAAKVEKHLGRSPALAAAEARRRLAARIEREASNPSQWSAAVDVLDLSGTIVGSRTIAKSSDSCGPVADALALVAALVLSQQALAESAPSPIHPPPPGPALDTATIVISPVFTSEVTPVAPASVAPSRPRRWTLAVDGGLVVGLGILPGLNLGGEARLLVAPPAWPALYASFALWSERTKTIAAGRGAALDLWTVGLGVCPLRALSPSWALALCAGGDVGRLRARGFGFSTAASDEQWLVELSAGGLIQRRLVRGLSAAIGLEIVIPWLSGKVAYSRSAGESVELWQRWPVAGVGSVRLVYAF